MITKGIIKSIDLLGNTCTVHIPFFETSGNDPIIETATVSNTPGSYNGYKVGDVVYVAFEDGEMSNPVVIGKLYLGTEAEKADPRGVINVEESTAAKKATLPADSKLSAELDKNVPNTTVPYNSLSSIANSLNKLNTDVAQNDRDYGNRFKQVSSAITETGKELKSEIDQSASNIRAEVSEQVKTLDDKIEKTSASFDITADEINAKVEKEIADREAAVDDINKNKLDAKNDGQKEYNDGDEIKKYGFGWDLNDNSWAIKAYDQTKDEGLPKDGLDIFKVTRDSVEINTDVRINGYPRVTTIRYAYSDSTTTYPALYKEGITQSLKDEDINLVVTGENGWTAEQLDWQDGKYIWQWTQTAKFEYKKVETGETGENGEKLTVDTWVDTITDKVICLAGASAASYWLNCSTKVHTGNQQDNITITAMMKVGTGAEKEDTTATLEYRWAGDTKYVCPKEKYKLSLSTNKIKNKNLEIIAKRNGQEYARETIIYSPLNTPILVLSKDSGSLTYDSYGLYKVNDDEATSTTASLLLNNSNIEAVSWSWELDGCSASSSTNAATIIITEIAADTDIATATCTATYSDNLGRNKTLSKTFTIVKNTQSASPYKIDIYNDFVTIPAKETGEIPDSIKDDLVELTTHSVSGYFGDELLAITEYITNTPTTQDTNFRIKYIASQNIVLSTDKNIVPPTFAISSMTDEDFIGSVIYELYRGTNKIAVAKFEVSKLTQGVSATSYWVDYSSSVHKGTNQQDTITATAWKKFGDNANTQNNELAIRYGWRQTDGNFGEYSEAILGQITVTANEFKNADLVFELGKFDEENNFIISDSEIITYSPINTPVLDLSNDSATLVYKPNGEKIGESTVSSTATVYLDGQELTEGVSYKWSDGTEGARIEISEIDAETREFTCTAKINNNALFKNEVELKKVFTISKQIQGENSISYWLKLSSGVHLGINQKTAITITAMQKVGTDAAEDIDESATLYYQYEGDTEWIEANYTIEVIPNVDKNLVIKAKHGEVEYETEIITYSPLNTPVLDLDNDTDTILYPAKSEDDINGPLGAPVESKATLYLNGDELAATYSWRLEDCSTSVTGVTNNRTITVAALKKDTARAICTAKVTAVGPFQGKEYEKAFTISKTRKGDNAIVYSLVMNQKSIKLDPNVETSTAAFLSGTCYIHDGNQIQPYSGGEVQYRIDTQSDNDQDADDFIEVNVGENGKFSFEAEDITSQVEVQLVINNIVVDKEIIKVVKDGINAVSPYTIDIYNDQASVLSETATLVDYDWKENTTHKIKVLQGSTVIESDNITVKAADTQESNEDKDLVLTYNLINIINNQFKEGTHTKTEKIYYIDGTEKDEILNSKIEYNLYYQGNLVATNKFEFLKILTGVSITGVTNKYYATANADADQENPLNNGEKLPANDEKDSEGNLKWKSSISETGYGDTKPYLWNYEIIEYSSGDPTKTDPALLGSRGKGIKAISEYYLLTSTSDTPNPPTKEDNKGWESDDTKPTQPTAEKPYLWNSEKIEYTDGDVEFTDSALVGTYTRSIKEVKNYYLATSSDYSSEEEKDNKPTRSTTGWAESISGAQFNAINKYLWNYEEIIYDRAITDGSNDTSKYTDPEIISTWSKSIDKIEEFYLISKSNNSDDFEDSANADGDWSKTAVSPNSTYPYLWNKEVTYFTDDTNNKAETKAIIIGTYGETFGVNIIPSVSSIKYKENADGSKIYTPETLSLEFKEISGTTVIDCGKSTKREYKYNISKIEGSTTTALVTDTKLDDKNTTVNFSITDNQTAGIYQIQLKLKNNNEWVVVTTEDIQSVREGNDGDSIVKISKQYLLLKDLNYSNVRFKDDNDIFEGYIDESKLWEEITEGTHYNLFTEDFQADLFKEYDSDIHKIFVREEYTYSSGTITYSEFREEKVVEEVFALKQGKSTNYYGSVDPAGTEGSSTYGDNMITGDCWFQTLTPESDEYNDEYDSESEVASNPQGILRQWTGTGWKDIGGELVANKLTANYINAMDITAKKIEIKDTDNKTTLFKADGLDGNHKVNIADFVVQPGRIVKNSTINSTGDTIYGVGMASTSGKFDPAFYAGFVNTKDKKGDGTYYGNPWEEPNGINWKDHTQFYVTQGGHLFTKDIEATGGKIAGFEISKNNIHSQNYIEDFAADPETNGIYIGTDGIVLGPKREFIVEKDGTVTASKLTVGFNNLGDDAKEKINSAQDTADSAQSTADINTQSIETIKLDVTSLQSDFAKIKDLEANKLRVTDSAGNILLLADGSNEEISDDERVKIGGFNVSASRISSNSNSGSVSISPTGISLQRKAQNIYILGIKEDFKANPMQFIKYEMITDEESNYHTGEVSSSDFRRIGFFYEDTLKISWDFEDGKPYLEAEWGESERDICKEKWIYKGIYFFEDDYYFEWERTKEYDNRSDTSFLATIDSLTYDGDIINNKFIVDESGDIDINNKSVSDTVNIVGTFHNGNIGYGGEILQEQQLQINNRSLILSTKTRGIPNTFWSDADGEYNDIVNDLFSSTNATMTTYDGIDILSSFNPKGKEIRLDAALGLSIGNTIDEMQGEKESVIASNMADAPFYVSTDGIMSAKSATIGNNILSNNCITNDYVTLSNNGLYLNTNNAGVYTNNINIYTPNNKYTFINSVNKPLVLTSLAKDNNSETIKTGLEVGFGGSMTDIEVYPKVQVGKETGAVNSFYFNVKLVDKDNKIVTLSTDQIVTLKWKVVRWQSPAWYKTYSYSEQILFTGGNAAAINNIKLEYGDLKQTSPIKFCFGTETYSEWEKETGDGSLSAWQTGDKFTIQTYNNTSAAGRILSYGNIIPSKDKLTLGTASQPWEEIYVKKIIYAGGGLQTNSLTYNSDLNGNASTKLKDNSTNNSSNCFDAGTKILMCDNSIKNIEEIKVGDIVRSYNIEKNIFENAEVLETLEFKTNQELVLLTFEDNTTLYTTMTHPFYTDHGWVSLKPWADYSNHEDLANQCFELMQVGQNFYKFDDNSDTIKYSKLSRIQYRHTTNSEHTVYNLNVDNTNIFFANNLLSHNKLVNRTDGGFGFINNNSSSIHFTNSVK